MRRRTKKEQLFVSMSYIKMLKKQRKIRLNLSRAESRSAFNIVFDKVWLIKNELSILNAKLFGNSNFVSSLNGNFAVN